MPLIVLGLGVVLLFVLIIVFKLNAFLSLIISSIVVGLCLGMEPLTIVESIKTGLGSTLGYIAIIIGLGAIFGKIISEGGGAHRIAHTLIKLFGVKKVDWAICLASFLLGVILFWEVAFILLIPIVFTVAVEAKVKLLKVGIPFLAATAITHCFLPPHPGPTMISGVLDANLGLVLAYGLILAIPGTILLGPLFSRFYKNWDIEIPTHLVSNKEFNMDEVSSFTTSVLVALAPVILILAGVIAEVTLPEESIGYMILTFTGDAIIALFIAVFIAMYVFGLRKKRQTMPQLMKVVETALVSMGGIIFIIGGGGAFKQVILDSGMADYIAELTSGWSISPYILAWIIALIIRLAVGSATVTVLTTAGIILPMMQTTGANPELMVLSIACASIAWAPPTDVSFWFTKEYFNLTIGQTVKLVSVQFTLLAIYGILGILLLGTFIA